MNKRKMTYTLITLVNSRRVTYPERPILSRGVQPRNSRVVFPDDICVRFRVYTNTKSTRILLLKITHRAREHKYVPRRLLIKQL